MAKTKKQNRAHTIVYRAVRDGRLERPDVCESCGQPSKHTLHAHHEDYDKPLDIIWLCLGCHMSTANRPDRKGEKNPGAYLTEEDVREIRRRYKEEDISQVQLALEYDMSKASISMMIRRKTWTHVEDRPD